MKILIFRSGAYGDVLILTPIIRYLHNQGHEIIAVVSKRGMEVLKNNPHISRLIQHKEDTPIDKLSENIEYLKKKFNCEKVYDFSESIEVTLSQHPRSPNYKRPKFERIDFYNKNFYEYAFEHARLIIPSDYPLVDSACDFYTEKNRNGRLFKNRALIPELFFEDYEIHSAKKKIKEGCFNVLMGLSGSGTNKTWPWSQDLAYKICEDFKDVHIITVGDERCKLIEPELNDRITNLSGYISMREAMALTGVVDLVIAPDTGIIHAAGCYDTPKICLLGHNTKECITKHFENDYSIESDSDAAPCSPCLFLIYDKNLQCPLDENAENASICMSRGIPLLKVYERFSEVYERFRHLPK